jgi:probable F420-dependent oxidoreductase
MTPAASRVIITESSTATDLACCSASVSAILKTETPTKSLTSGMVHYVDALLDGRVPADAIVIGALGTNTLRLAGEKTLGAHPYLTVPAHTRHARETLGSSAFLAPEHKVVLTEDDGEARKIGRPAVQNPYLGLRNYTNNLMRHGFTEADVDGSGSDALIDALVAHGSAETIYTQINGHLTAGANHIGIQVFTDDPPPHPCRPSDPWPNTAPLGETPNNFLHNPSQEGSPLCETNLGPAAVRKALLYVRQQRQHG